MVALWSWFSVCLFVSQCGSVLYHSCVCNALKAEVCFSVASSSGFLSVVKFYLPFIRSVGYSVVFKLFFVSWWCFTRGWLAGYSKKANSPVLAGTQQVDPREQGTYLSG